MTEEQRRQVPARKQPSGLPIFGAAAALLVGRRSIKDILPRRALQHRQIYGNAPVPHFDMGSEAGFFRITQMQRMIWAEKIDGKLRLRKWHASNPESLSRTAAAFDHDKGKWRPPAGRRPK